MTVKVDVEIVEVQGRKIVFKVSAHDGMDLIGEGRHERVVVAGIASTPRSRKRRKPQRSW